MSKYGVISSSYFLVFRLNTGKYGTEIIPHLDTFHVVYVIDWILFVIYLSFVVLKCIGEEMVAKFAILFPLTSLKGIRNSSLFHI